MIARIPSKKDTARSEEIPHQASDASGKLGFWEGELPLCGMTVEVFGCAVLKYFCRCLIGQAERKQNQ
jgi:hypothetical protein